MESHERIEFVNAFSRLLTRAWSDEDEAARLAENPKEAAVEVGLTVPADGEVVIVRDVDGEYTGEQFSWIDAQIALWESGLETGRYELHVPRTPQLDTAELAESELAAAGTGRAPSCRCG